jgi:dihydrofolate synthase/folylpolyglutamate synthase
MVERLAEVAHDFIVTSPEAERAVVPDELARRVADVIDLPVFEAKTVRNAVEMAKERAGSEGSVLVAGSLYLVGEVREMLVGETSSRGGSPGGPAPVRPEG